MRVENQREKAKREQAERDRNMPTDWTAADRDFDAPRGDLVTVTTERIEKAVEQATLAYWAEVVKHFPEVETGDFSPEDSHAQDTANTEAVDSWLMWNHPNPFAWG